MSQPGSEGAQIRSEGISGSLVHAVPSGAYRRKEERETGNGKQETGNGKQRRTGNRSRLGQVRQSDCGHWPCGMSQAVHCIGYIVNGRECECSWCCGAMVKGGNSGGSAQSIGREDRWCMDHAAHSMQDAGCRMQHAAGSIVYGPCGGGHGASGSGCPTHRVCVTRLWPLFTMERKAGRDWTRVQAPGKGCRLVLPRASETGKGKRAGGREVFDGAGMVLFAGSERGLHAGSERGTRAMRCSSAAILSILVGTTRRLSGGAGSMEQAAWSMEQGAGRAPMPEKRSAGEEGSGGWRDISR
jgi:hypothetical protein